MADILSNQRLVSAGHLFRKAKSTAMQFISMIQINWERNERWNINISTFPDTHLKVGENLNYLIYRFKGYYQQTDGCTIKRQPYCRTT